MKNKFYLLCTLALTGLIISISSCNKEEPEPEPTPDPDPGITDTAPTAVVFDIAPANGATNIGSPASISWLAATDAEGDAITYDVYFGKNSGSLDLVSADQTGLSYTSAELDLGTTYYFKVDAKSTTFNTSSETRDFESAFTGSFTDSRDSQDYGTVLIGNQVWMTENLVYVSSGSYSYNDNTSNDANYGRLYEWASVSGAVPAGWHLPTDDEWKTLETVLGMPTGDLNINDYNTDRGTDQGTQLKAGGTSGLDFPMAGYRNAGTYSALDNKTYLWTNTDVGGSNILRRRIEAANSFCFRFTNPSGNYAISVRLVKD